MYNNMLQNFTRFDNLLIEVEQLKNICAECRGLLDCYKDESDDYNCFHEQNMLKLWHCKKCNLYYLINEEEEENEDKQRSR